MSTGDESGTLAEYITEYVQYSNRTALPFWPIFTNYSPALSLSLSIVPL